jgi:hypothetical protein
VLGNSRPHVRNGTRKLQQPHLERARLGKSKRHSDGLKQLRDQAIRAGLIEAPQIGPANMASSAMTAPTTVPAVIPFSAAPVETRAIMLLPSAKDRVYGPGHEENRAFVQMIVGQGSRAISTLTQLGTFAAIRIAYTMEKPDGKETYHVLTNATGARVLLKEEFSNGAIAELVSLNE